MTADRFVLLRGTHAGPVFLARADHPDDADVWTADRDGARRFDDRAEAEAARAEIVARTGFSVAVVPDQVGPGSDRPVVHSYAEARRNHRVALADLAALQASVL